MEDKEIISLYEKRLESAIVESEQKYGLYCRYIAARILPIREDVEECLNDTWICTWNSIPPNKPSDLKAYVGRITRNCAIKKYDRLTADKRAESQYAISLEELSEVLSGGSEPEELRDCEAIRDAIHRFLRALPKQARIVFVKRYFYMNSICEIADAMGMTSGNVRVLLHRTRDKLRVYLEKEGILP